MMVGVLKKLLGLAEDVMDSAARNDAEREKNAVQQRQELEEAERQLRALQYKVDVMLRGVGSE